MSEHQEDYIFTTLDGVVDLRQVKSIHYPAFPDFDDGDVVKVSFEILSGNRGDTLNLIHTLNESDIPTLQTRLLQPMLDQTSTHNSGGSCNYYTVQINKPTTLEKPYTVECNDLIESLKLNWQEANIYKEIFRTANERTHNNGKKGNTPKRAAEKVLFFALRNAMLNGVDVDKLISEINTK